MLLYLSVAASLGTTLVRVPSRTGASSWRMYGICDSSEKIADVWPVMVLGPDPAKQGSVSDKAQDGY